MPSKDLEQEIAFKKESLKRLLRSLQVDVNRAVIHNEQGRTVGCYSMLSTLTSAMVLEAELKTMEYFI